MKKHAASFIAATVALLGAATSAEARTSVERQNEAVINQMVKDGVLCQKTAPEWDYGTKTRKPVKVRDVPVVAFGSGTTHAFTVGRMSFTGKDGKNYALTGNFITRESLLDLNHDIVVVARRDGKPAPRTYGGIDIMGPHTPSSAVLFTPLQDCNSPLVS